MCCGLRLGSHRVPDSKVTRVTCTYFFVPPLHLPPIHQADERSVVALPGVHMHRPPVKRARGDATRHSPPAGHQNDAGNRPPEVEKPLRWASCLVPVAVSSRPHIHLQGLGRPPLDTQLKSGRALPRKHLSRSGHRLLLSHRLDPRTRRADSEKEARLAILNHPA